MNETKCVVWFGVFWPFLTVNGHEFQTHVVGTGEIDWKVVVVESSSKSGEGAKYTSSIITEWIKRYCV